MRIRKSLQVLLQFKMIKEKWKRAWAWIDQVEDYTPEVFVKSQWQFGETSTLYLMYRWMLAGFFLCGMLASMLDLGRDLRRGGAKSSSRATHYLKWPIYLTNWGFTACTVQAVMSTIHVTKYYAKMRLHPNTVDMEKMKKSYKMYWILHSVAVIASIVITAMYWLAVYNPNYDELDGVNLTVHLFNSVLMVLDLWIVAHPFKLLHCYWAFIFGCSYAIFNYLYFISGGTDRIGRIYVYQILDWRQPVNALIAVAGTMVFEAMVTVFVWMMSIVKRRLANLFHHKMSARRFVNVTQDTDDRGPRIV